MKLNIVSDVRESKEGYVSVHSFSEFADALNTNNEHIEEIYISSYLLGLVCLYWFVDHFRDAVKMINYTINLKDPNQSECLKQMIKRYAKEDK